MRGTYRLAPTGRSTATSYHFRGTYVRPDGTDGAPEGWAICTVNDRTGELSIQSDWTDGCGFRWNTDHLGAPTLTEFIAGERQHYDYFVGKLLPVERRERFSPEKTLRRMRQEICHARRRGDLDRANARDIWDDLAGLAHQDDGRDFFDAVPDSYHQGVDQNPRMECWMEEPTREALALEGWILPALADACRAEVQRRAEPVAAPPPAAAPTPVGDIVFNHGGRYFVRKADGQTIRLREMETGAAMLLPGDPSTREVILAKALDMAIAKAAEAEKQIERAFAIAVKETRFHPPGSVVSLVSDGERWSIVMPSGARVPLSDRLQEVAEHDLVVNRHQFQNLLERFADLAYEANRITSLMQGDCGSIDVDFGVEESPASDGDGGDDGGVWVHDPAALHPCDYACGAIYIERSPTRIEVQMGTDTIGFDREVDDEAEPTPTPDVAAREPGDAKARP